MSNNRTDEQDKEEEEEEEEEEEDEHEHEEEEELFYESLDRALSTPQSLCSPSSSISCSDSDSDSDSASDDDDENCGQSNNTVPKFPDSSSFSTYEVWTTQPSSVEERRKRLLRDMGLIADASLSRSKPSVDESLDFVARSVSSSSSDHNPTESCSPVISRSISDTNAADCESSSFHRQCNHSCCRSSCYRCLVNNNNNDDDNSNRIIVSKSRSNGSPIANFASSTTTTTTTSPNKPPTGKPSPLQSSRRMTAEEIRSDSLSPNPNPSLNSLPTALANADEEKVVGDDVADCCDGMVGNSDQVCTIKNLDNGEEFVVNEFGEDGMWDKVREVGTGRQLTMEEFETCVGHSPIVQELMRRQNVEQLHSRKESKDGGELNLTGGDSSNGDGTKPKKKGGWFKSIKNVANTVTGYRDRRSSDERDTSSERGGRRSSSATDDSQDVSFHGPERVRVRQYGKSCKELTGMYKTQEIQAHNGSIWSVKFSLDGQYLASAGEDCIIHIWHVLESDRKEFSFMDKRDDGNLNMYFTANGSPEPTLLSSNGEQPPERKRRGRTSISRKSISLDNIVVPESVFALSEKPIHSFYGHQDVVLDLSWSKSQLLLSSSMDKTVRLWDMATDSCLKVFSHSDYVTCIQFNPVDDRYFISGSLDAKVRIWSIPDRQVIDWYDLHEMVTATCYTPDGKGALVGSYKGSCCLFNTSENKLHQKHQINLQNKKKKSHLKKITGFQFAPGSSSEVLITSADSRIRVIDGVDLVHKFKGFCNTSSQISASLTANGKYAICASGDSHVYIWNNEGHSQPSRSKVVTITSSYEYFHCQDVSVAIPWPGFGDIDAMQDTYSRENSGLGSQHDELSAVSHSPLMEEGSNGHAGSPSVYGCINSPLHGTLSSTTSSYFFDRISATWPEENLFLANRNQSPRSSVDFSNGLKQSSSAWGTVIVTAGLRGEIKTFQNFGLPYRL